MRKKTAEQFIAEAKAVHGGKYDYSKTEYRTNREKVLVICPEHGEFWQSPKSHLRGCGCKKCYQCSKHKYGVAICDIPNACHEEYYNTWRSMLERTVGGVYKKKYHTYMDCEVCEEWITLSNFKEWFEDPENGYQEGYHLDKDILVKGNKVYSPQTCCFVPPKINLLFAHKRKRNNLPAGVTKKGGGYTAQLCINGEKVYLGYYYSPQEAFAAYKDAKERHIKSVAESCFKEGMITEKVYQALMKYEVEITD